MLGAHAMIIDLRDALRRNLTPTVTEMKPMDATEVSPIPLVAVADRDRHLAALEPDMR
jgi:hypothetical protein